MNLSFDILKDINDHLSEFIDGGYTEIEKSFAWGDLNIFNYGEDTSLHIQILINKDKIKDCILD